MRVFSRSITSCTYILCGYGLGASLVVAITGDGTKASMEGVIDSCVVNVDF